MDGFVWLEKRGKMRMLNAPGDEGESRTGWPGITGTIGVGRGPAILVRQGLEYTCRTALCHWRSMYDVPLAKPGRPHPFRDGRLTGEIWPAERCTCTEDPAPLLFLGRRRL